MSHIETTVGDKPLAAWLAEIPPAPPDDPDAPTMAELATEWGITPQAAGRIVKKYIEQGRVRIGRKLAGRVRIPTYRLLPAAE